MSTPPPRSSNRLLAPLALVVCAVAVLAVVAGSLSGEDSGGGGTAPATAADTDATQTAPAPAPPGPRVYVVESGDTLGAIADETGVSEDELSELNPELDPQALIVGQKIALRE